MEGQLDTVRHQPREQLEKRILRGEKGHGRDEPLKSQLPAEPRLPWLCSELRGAPASPWRAGAEAAPRAETWQVGSPRQVGGRRGEPAAARPAGCGGGRGLRSSSQTE